MNRTTSGRGDKASGQDRRASPARQQQQRRADPDDPASDPESNTPGDQKPGGQQPKAPPIEKERGPQVPDELPGKPDVPKRV